MIPLRLPSAKGARNRYAVAPVEQRTFEGKVFASQREMVRFGFLRLELKSGRISELETQPSWIVNINGKRLCRYTADFRYVRNGAVVIEEVKSSGTAKDAAYKLRRRAAELEHGIVITEIVA